MKYLILSLLALTTCCFSKEKEVTLSEIGQVLASMEEFDSVILKLNPGDEIPINFNLSGDILKLENTPENGKIQVMEPLYIKVEPAFLFSRDKEEWKTFESYFTGNVGVSVDANISNAGSISIDLNRR